MFDYLQLRWKLWHLEWWRWKTNRKYDRKLAAANAIADAAERNTAIEALESTSMFEDQMLDDEVYELHTWYLRSEARRLIIPLDSWRDTEAWSEGVTGKKHMNAKAINELRSAIRAEKKAGTERFVIWMPGVVGIIGALIGLASILAGLGKPPGH